MIKAKLCRKKIEKHNDRPAIQATRNIYPEQQQQKLTPIIIIINIIINPSL